MASDERRDIVGEIRAIYFATTRQTILDDFDRAIDLLKALDSEEERERAAVYMEGLADLRKEFRRGGRGPK
ncbi:MAG: hypothetical protein AB1635_01705 [Acidobacteriota bacterium]